MLNKTVHEKDREKNWEQLYVTQRLILWNPEDKKFLLLKYTPFLSVEANVAPWGFIGGHLENEEILVDALQRETLEEAGSIDYEIVGVIDVDRYKDDTLSVRYLALYKGGEIILSEEHTEYVWMTVEEIEKDEMITPRVKGIVRLAAERLKEHEYLNDLQRLQADFANYKKRQQEAQKELAGYLIEKLVMEITPVLDNFHMATIHIPADACNTPWVTGIQYIEKQLEKVLEDNGMQVIEAKEGDVFDPRIHEAISSEPASAEATAGEEEKSTQQVVAKALQKGYKIGEKVIRPAKVAVK